MEQLKKLHPWLTDAELTTYSELPKKEDGKTFDLDKMDAEQRALFYKDRAEAQAAGFNKFKTEKDTELGKLKSENDELKKGKPSDTLSEQDLEKHVPGYKELTDSEKELVKSTIAPVIKNQQELASLVKTLNDKQLFETEFTDLVEQDEYKVLEKHKKGFKEFAYQDENLNTPIAILADAYIKRNKLETETKGRNGLEDGSGGDRFKAPKEGMNAAEMARLRTSDPKRYSRLARTGKLSETLKKGSGVE